MRRCRRRMCNSAWRFIFSPAAQSPLPSSAQRYIPPDFASRDRVADHSPELSVAAVLGDSTGPDHADWPKGGVQNQQPGCQALPLAGERRDFGGGLQGPGGPAHARAALDARGRASHGGEMTPPVSVGVCCRAKQGCAVRRWRARRRRRPREQAAPCEARRARPRHRLSR